MTLTACVFPYLEIVEPDGMLFCFPLGKSFGRAEMGYFLRLSAVNVIYALFLHGTKTAAGPLEWSRVGRKPISLSRFRG